MSFSRGAHTLTISAELFAENRRRLLAKLRKVVGARNVVLLEGGKEPYRDNTDVYDLPFRQESYFFWTFGVHESDCFGAIDIDSGKSFLFPPRLHPDFAIWMGKINPESWFVNKYKVNEVHFNDENVIFSTLKRLNTEKLLLLRAENSDSGSVLSPADFKGKDKFNVDVETLYPIIADLRVFKTDKELEVIRYANKVASDAHKAVMKHVVPGMYEYQLESLFRHECYFNGGCRHLAYTCIAATGADAAILHYGHANAPNERMFNDGDLCLMDMGPEYSCYASDITTTFPCNGKFTDKQKTIYNAVLLANRTIKQEAKPGVRWSDMHLLAEKVILTELRRAGLVVGDVDKMVKAGVGAIFMPHGLGHFLGLDVHDVGGYLADATPRATRRGLKSLRTTRTLRERMVITVEPGCYFIDTLLDSALHDPEFSQYLVPSKLNEFRGFGGVRIEDTVVIWNEGAESLSHLPRTVEEIEEFMKK
ncbi:hypothetical protein AB6A40_004164 [Gnathostoma spinigerum]|uniref:Xaa-Pro dipeptidase n=1 Tax=Gnathostoma spinigerum TaxID=75299 RepID=A0ABD6ECU1_9BILA